MRNGVQESFREEAEASRRNTLDYQEALARGNMYRFLSALFLSPPQQDLLEYLLDENSLDTLSTLFGEKGVMDLREFAATFDEDLESLKQEYTDLFAVPSGRYVTPFEDVYRGRTIHGKQERGPLLGERAIMAIRIYREAGAQMNRECKELPTHIGVELSFMSFLCRGEASALRKEVGGPSLNQERTKTRESVRFRRLQQRFLRDHLNEWFPQLSQSIQSNAKNPFYRGLGLITETFLAQEMARSKDPQ